MESLCREEAIPFFSLHWHQWIQIERSSTQKNYTDALHSCWGQQNVMTTISTNDKSKNGAQFTATRWFSSFDFWFISCSSQFADARTTFCIRLCRMMVGLCFNMIINTSYFVFSSVDFWIEILTEFLWAKRSNKHRLLVKKQCIASNQVECKQLNFLIIWCLVFVLILPLTALVLGWLEKFLTTTCSFSQRTSSACGSVDRNNSYSRCQLFKLKALLAARCARETERTAPRATRSAPREPFLMHRFRSGALRPVHAVKCQRSN